MNTFLELVEQILTEDNSTAGVGVGTTGTQFSADTYAPKTTVIPCMLGGVTKRTFPPLMNSKKSKKKIIHHKKKK